MSDQQIGSGQFLSTREYFDLSIKPIARDLELTRLAIEELSKELVSRAEFERLSNQVNETHAAVAGLDERVGDLENYHNVGMWVFRTVTGVGIAVGIAGLIKFLVG